MSKQYTYVINVSFSTKNSECAIGEVRSKYSNGNGSEDCFNFRNNGFKIIACRSKHYKLDSIFSNNSNSINSQMLKGLLYYYSLANSFPKIKNISITNESIKSECEYNIDKSKIIQPIIQHNESKKDFDFNKDVLKEVFNESDRGNTYRIAISYWLKGIASTERYYKFDHLWRAFNRLYLYQADTNKDVDGRIDMRRFIIANPSYFPKTISITNSLNQVTLRSFRWRSLILNDYDKFEKTNAFKDFVFRYNDPRIMTLFSDILPYRKDFLSRANLLNDVKEHITQTHIQRDEELMALLSLKYAYFVRNKMFHGEIPDSTFKIQDDFIDKEIDILNNILSTLIFEILNNDILRRLTV